MRAGQSCASSAASATVSSASEAQSRKRKHLADKASAKKHARQWSVVGFT